MEKEFEYVGECSGNDGNGCFMDSCGHNCGCFKRVPKKLECDIEVFSEGNYQAFKVVSGRVKEIKNDLIKQLFDKKETNIKCNKQVVSSSACLCEENEKGKAISGRCSKHNTDWIQY